MSVANWYARRSQVREFLHIRRNGFGTVVGNVSTLSATTAITSALGFVYWSLAARNAPPAAVGLAAAAISASSLLASISMLGLGTLLIGEVAAGRDRDHSVLTTSLLVVGGVSVSLGVAFAVIGPEFLKDVGTASLGWPFVVLFALTSATTALGLLLDQLMVGLLKSGLQLARNSVFSLAKLGALVIAAPLLFTDNGLIVFGAWPLGNLLSIVALVGFVCWRPVGIGLGRPRLQLVRHMGGKALGHHALNLSAQAAGQIMPVLVAGLLSTTANAYFYTSWMVATVALIPQNALSVTLYALGAREPEALRGRARLTLVLGLLEALAAIAVVEVLAPWILAGFGKTYAAEATVTLRILVLAVVPAVIKAHFISLSRITGRVRSGGMIMGSTALFELAGAVIGALLGGLPGLAAGWVIGVCLEAVCMLPRVWDMVRPAPHLPAQQWQTHAR